MSDRAGRYVRQAEGYRAFIPSSLPPDPPLEMDGRLIAQLVAATDAVGRLDGVTQTLPNVELFVAMYVRQEAVLSSQIEGTQSTLDDVLAFELDPARRELPQDVTEVVNYVRAMNHGLERLQSLPLSLRLLREIHAELLASGRGAWKTAGEFRRSQNWIGPEGASLSGATFVPPPVHEMTEALGDLETFLHDDHGLPPLVECGLAHAQFETIHPFLDGNGRVGRLLVTFLLTHRGVLSRPLLYLSHYLRQHRATYYDRLTAIREDGDWEGWLLFFLRGVAEVAGEAAVTARRILELREEERSWVEQAGLGTNGLRAVDVLFQRPLIDANTLKDELEVSFNTANKILEAFEGSIVNEITGGRRNRVFRHHRYLELFHSRGVPQEPPGTLEETAAGGAPT